MVVCNSLFTMLPLGYSFAYGSPEDPFQRTQTWSGVMLAGFIMACISNYCLLFCAPLFMGGRAAQKRKADSEEERRGLAGAADS